MEDANDFSWDAARARHAVLLCRMEQGEVKNYCDTDKLDRIRRANAQRHVTTLSLAPTSIRAHVCTKGPTILKVPPTDTFVVIAFSKQEKHIHMLNKIAETKIPKNQCQKTSSLGGGGGGGGGDR